MNTPAELEHYADILLDLVPSARASQRGRGRWRRFRVVLREGDLRPDEECLFGTAIDRIGFRSDGTLALELTPEERRTLFQH